MKMTSIEITNTSVGSSIESPTESDAPKNNRLRRQSGHLSKLDIPNSNNNNVFFSPSILQRRNVTEKETIQEGKVLMGNFIVEKIRKEVDLATLREIDEDLEIFSPKVQYGNAEWTKAGQQLKMFADDFIRSEERKNVQDQASKVGKMCQHGISQAQFNRLLDEYLAGGICKKKIAILFVFCADVAMAVLRYNSSSGHLCRMLIEWSIQYMVDHVCIWVQQHGGWGYVFGASLDFLWKIAVVVGAGALCYMGYRKLKG